MLPFRLKPVYKNYLWGGKKLIHSWGKDSGTEILAESWELASHKDGDNIILDGPCKNLTLSEAVKKYPEIVSPEFKPDSTFPLMFKLIDSQLPLSIQVHPDDDYAMIHEHSKGKVESWYILNHEEGAYIYLGLKHKVSRSELEDAIMNHSLPDILNKIYVNDGDTFFIPSGTLHAIGSGVTLAEIQENSNITYRVYDYGRLGADGKPRELHIAKALDVANLEPVNYSAPGQTGNIIVECKEFCVERVNAPYSGMTNHEGFRFILCIDGMIDFTCGDVNHALQKGGNVFVPSDCENVFMIEGNGECLITSE